MRSPARKADKETPGYQPALTFLWRPLEQSHFGESLPFKRPPLAGGSHPGLRSRFWRGEAAQLLVIHRKQFLRGPAVASVQVISDVCHLTHVGLPSRISGPIKA